MHNWERDDVLYDIQKRLPWAVVLDVFSGEGWWAVAAMKGVPAAPVRVKYFVKIAPLGERRKRQRPRLAVAVEDAEGRMVVYDRPKVALFGSIQAKDAGPFPRADGESESSQESGR
ncbi:MAG: hypothetical protein P8R42_07280 [Candidatus Binatia bacterium]|nr:hypothetical protein [Candidatus Binatia bacterium]